MQNAIWCGFSGVFGLRGALVLGFHHFVSLDLVSITGTTCLFKFFRQSTCLRLPVSPGYLRAGLVASLGWPHQPNTLNLSIDVGQTIAPFT